MVFLEGVMNARDSQTKLKLQWKNEIEKYAIV